MAIAINGIRVAGIGAPGKSAYQAAQEAGYQGTETEFNLALAVVKQEKLVGVAGQIVGFDADGNAVAQDMSNVGSGIVITNEVPEDVDVWIDPDEEDQNDSFYTKTQTEEYVSENAAAKDLSNVDSAALLAAIEAAGGAGAKIATGSYNGTGTYGVNNKNSLKFGFEPKFVIINYTQFYNQAVSYMIYSYGSECFTCWTGHNSFASLSGNTLTWYHNDNAASQANESGKTYKYLAIG